MERHVVCKNNLGKLGGDNMGPKIRARHYIVTKYWLDYYTSKCCTLCGNSGIVDTTGVKTAAGVMVGRKNFCICPNGQELRYNSKKHERKRNENHDN